MAVRTPEEARGSNSSKRIGGAFGHRPELHPSTTMRDTKPKLTATYFDASAINLAVARGMEWMRRQIPFPIHRVYFSATNLEEINATPDPDKRAKLGGLVRELADDFRPLASPKSILCRSLQAFLEGKDSMRGDVDEDEESYWGIQNDGGVDDETASALRQHKKAERSRRSQVDKEARAMMCDLGLPRLRSASEHLRACFDNDVAIADSVGGLLSGMCGIPGAPDSVAEIRNAIVQVESWKFMLAAECAEIFWTMAGPRRRRRWRIPGGGYSSVPGQEDRQQVVYLALCRTFVVSDWGFYNLLRLLRPLANAPRNLVYVHP